MMGDNLSDGQSPLPREWARPSLRHPTAGVRTEQELLGYVDEATTMIYTHVLRMGGSAVRSTLDSLPGAEEPQSCRW